MTTSPPDYTTSPSNVANGPPAIREEQLPAYAPEGTGAYKPFVPSSGIDDKLPTHFKIGKNYAAPFVQPSDLQAHLILLGAFHRLREEVRTQKGVDQLTATPEDRWALFLERAVHRFELWAHRMLGNDEDADASSPKALLPNQYPPIDVALVWLTYMLNPKTYYEDCLRKLSGLGSIGFELLNVVDLCSTIDQETLLPHTPSGSRVAAFTSFTGLGFEPPIATKPEDEVAISCPNCAQWNNVPWITYRGDGYGQRGFLTTCTRLECRMQFDRESLCVRKFYEDLERCALEPDRYFLANTLVDWSTGLPNPKLGATLTSLVLGYDLGVAVRRPEVYAHLIGWTFNDIEKYCREGYLAKRNKPYIDTPRPLSLVLSAYRHPGPASIDLASAAMRQFSFIDKMVQLSWTEPGRFDDDMDTLTRCVVRYHYFLDLMESTPGKYVVPTLDVDLAWHTHQLLCSSYRKLEDVVGIIPDHDDKVAQNALSTAYDETAAAWKEKFGVPYSVCGCLPPIKALSTSSGGGGGMASVFSRKGKAKASPDKAVDNHRTDLIATDDVNAEETHPSDHYAVAVINPGQQGSTEAAARRKEIAKRSQEANKAIVKGKADQWTALQQRRSVDHSLSFLCPVHWGDQQGLSAFGHGDCAAHSGQGVRGNFSVGECVKGSGFKGLCAVSFERPRDGFASAVALSMMERGDRRMLDDLAFSQVVANQSMLQSTGAYYL